MSVFVCLRVPLLASTQWTLEVFGAWVCRIAKTGRNYCLRASVSACECVYFASGVSVSVCM